MSNYRGKSPIQRAQERLAAKKEGGLLDQTQFDMENVTSTNVQAIGYNRTFERLRVTYKNGTTYQYFGVDSATWTKVRKGMARAMSDGHTPSIGAAIDKYIKKAGITYQKE